MSFTASARPRPAVSLTGAFGLLSGSPTPIVARPNFPLFGLPTAPVQLVDQILRVLRSDAPDSADSKPVDTTGALETGASGTGSLKAESLDAQQTAVPTAQPPENPREDLEDPPVVKGPFAVDDLSMEELVREHADAVYRVALSVTRDPTLAEDASQDALIKAWQALPSFRGDAPLRNWILRITHNTAISLLRKRRDELRDPNELPDTISHRTVESQVHDRMALDRFELALQDLDSLSRSIVVLREVEGLSYDEICDVLDLPMPTVKTRLLRARRQLALALDGWQP